MVPRIKLSCPFTGFFSIQIKNTNFEFLSLDFSQNYIVITKAPPALIFSQEKLSLSCLVLGDQFNWWNDLFKRVPPSGMLS